MSTENQPTFVRIALTEEQRAQVRQSTGVEADAIELSVKELEDRIAPKVSMQDFHFT